MNWPVAESHALIIGIGNTLRGDDGVGPAVAQTLESLLADAPVRVIACHQLLPEMAEDLSRASLVVFVDASCDLPPGRVQWLPVEPPQQTTQAATHDFDPPRLLGLAKQIYGRAPKAFVVAVGAQSFEFEEKLSPAVLQAFDAVVQQVCQIACPQATRKAHDHA